jgi:hypothetical protein
MLGGQNKYMQNLIGKLEKEETMWEYKHILEIILKWIRVWPSGLWHSMIF